MSINVLIIDREFDPTTLSEELKRVYAFYLLSLQHKTAFDMLLPLKKRNPARYLEQCLLLAGRTQYMSFDKRRLHFVVRPSIDGKRVYLGASDNYNEACNFIKIYLTEKQKEDAENID